MAHCPSCEELEHCPSCEELNQQAMLKTNDVVVSQTLKLTSNTRKALPYAFPKHEIAK